MEIYKRYYLADTIKDFVGSIVAILRSLIISLVAGGFAVWRSVGTLPMIDTMTNAIIGVGIGAGAWFGILFIANIIRAPAKLNQDRLRQISLKDDEIQNIKAENQVLEDAAKPKLDIRLVENGDTYKQVTDFPNGVHQTLFRVSIHNVSSSEAVNGISVELSTTLPKALDYLPAQLHAMNDAGKTLNAGQQMFIDVVFVNDSYQPSGDRRDLHFYFEREDIRVRDLIPLRAYALKITASGNNSPEAGRTFRFFVDDENQYHFVG